MTAVLRLFWNICLLRDGPETVPTHTWFLSTLIVAHLTMGVLSFRVAYPTLSPLLALNWVLIGLAVTVGMAWFVLYLRNQEPRFPATLGAIVGTKVMIVGTNVLIGALTSLTWGTLTGTPRQSVGWILTIWGLVVVGFILHRALSTRLWVGIVLAAVTWLTGVVVAQSILGPAISASLEAVR